MTVKPSDAEARHGCGGTRRSLPVTLWAGAVILVIVIGLGFLAPVMAPYSPTEHRLAKRLAPPGADHWFGTDEYGRDIFSRVLYGINISLVVGVGATLVCLALGVPVGMLAGYFRGRLDELIMRALDVVMAFPPILLGLLILAMTEPAPWKTILAVGIVYVPAIARITRSVTLSLAEEEFVEAARARGESWSYIIFREILPNSWPPIIVEGSLRITFAILLGAGLSFLGLGAQPPTPDWGLMISEARAFVTLAPWAALFPGLAMCVTVIGFNLLGDGLRDVLDPRVYRAGH